MVVGRANETLAFCWVCVWLPPLMVGHAQLEDHMAQIFHDQSGKDASLIPRDEAAFVRMADRIGHGKGRRVSVKWVDSVAID